MSTFLHRALPLDAVATGATAALLLAGAGLLAEPLGLPAGLMHGAGLVLVPFVALVHWTGLRPVPPRGAAWAIVGLNAAWVLASLGLLVVGSVVPTAAGTALVIGQAVVVGAFGEFQAIGLRRARTASA